MAEKPVSSECSVRMSSWRGVAAAALAFCFVFLLSQASPLYAKEGVTFNGVLKKPVNVNGKGVDSTRSLIIKSIAILPFDNLTLNMDAPELVRILVREELKGRGWVFLAKDDSVEEFLLRRRIRYTGSVTRLTAREMGKVLNVDAVAVGTVTQYDDVGGRVAVGISMRLVSTLDGSIIWADNLAYSGVEFEGILGLGSVKSLDVLSSMVVKDIVDSIASKFFIKDMAQSPFEIERVITFPAIGKAGDKVDIIVDIVPILEEPKELRIIIDDTEYILEKIREGRYKGEITAPMEEGVYSVDVVVLNGESVPFVFAAETRFTVDVTPPDVNMTLGSVYISPINSKNAVIETQIRNIEAVDEWRIDVIDADGKKVRTDFGFGFLPSKLEWRGEDDKSRWVVDGAYKVVLSVRDVAGNTTVTEDNVFVKTTPPKVDVAFALNEGVAEFRLTPPPDAKVQEWSFAIRDKDGVMLKVLSGSDANFPEKIEYPLDSKNDIRKLAFSITAKDSVGNVYSETKSLPAIFREKVPFAEMMNGNDRVWKEF